MVEALQGQAGFQELRSDPAFMSAPIPEQVQYLREEYLPKKDPAFAQAPKAEQEQYIHEAVLPQIQGIAKAQGPAPANQDWFQNTPLASFFKTYPAETPAQTEARTQQANQPISGGLDGMWASSNPTQMQEGSRIGLSNQLKGLTLGYVDPFKPSQPLNQTGQTLAGANQLAGTLPLWELGAAGVDKGLTAAGRQVLPYTTEIAQAAGASRYSRPVMNALTQLQGPAMWARMVRSSVPLTGIGALESQPGHQLDLGSRAQAAGTGFLSGLLFPPLEDAGAALLKGGVKVVQNIFQQNQAPIKIAQDSASQYLQQLINSGMSQGRIKYEMRKFKNAIPTAQLQADLDQLVHDIYSGSINKSHVSEVDANKLGAHLKQVQQAIKTGQELKPSDKSNITGTIKSIRTKDAMKQKVDARRLQVANENHESFGPSARQDYEAQAAVQRFKERQARQQIADENHEAFGPDWQQDKAAQDIVLNAKVKKARQAIANENHESFSPSTLQHVQAKKAAKGELPTKSVTVNKEETTSQPEPVKAPQKPLTGTVKEMVSQAEKAAGLPQGAGSLTVGQLEKQMGQPLTQEQKDAHANLREVAKTEPDPDKPIARQMPVNEEKQLLHGEVKEAIPTEKQPVAEKINTALESGKKIKWEVAAERSGRSNEAAHVTATGNVKITPTEFTPTHWSKSNSGEVFIHGYNQRGHVTMHPIEDVHKVVKTDAGNGFQGTVSNRVLGQRDYLVSDILNRGPRSESGAIKTSEAIQLLTEIKDVYKPENFNKFSKPIRDKLNAIRKKGRIDKLDLAVLAKALENKKAELEEFCKIVGIHG